VLTASAVPIVEVGIMLETDPAPVFADRAWYVGAYMQYHAALTLAVEIYYRPDNPLADRIWYCLNFVFGLNPAESTKVRAGRVLGEIMGKMGAYQRLRKIRAPTTVSSANVPSGHEAPPARTGQQQRRGHAGSGNPLAQHQQLQSVKVEGSPTATTFMSGALPHSQPPLTQTPPAFMPGMVFAGVSNGEALWSLPAGAMSIRDSPEGASSDGGSISGQLHGHGIPMPHPHNQHDQHGMPMVTQAPMANPLEGLDMVSHLTTFPPLAMTSSPALAADLLTTCYSTHRMPSTSCFPTTNELARLVCQASSIPRECRSGAERRHKRYQRGLGGGTKWYDVKSPHLTRYKTANDNIDD
jgi:hypothetical protein